MLKEKENPSTTSKIITVESSRTKVDIVFKQQHFLLQLGLQKKKNLIIKLIQIWEMWKARRETLFPKRYITL